MRGRAELTQSSGYSVPWARPWRPAPAVGLSLLLHAAAVATLVVSPGLWPWVIGVLAANHLLLIAAVLWPRGRILGPNLVRLPAAAAARNEVSLSFDDGPDPKVTPRVLDLLDCHQARASFFCIGEKAAAFPELVREIARRGHSVENHSHSHPNAFAFYGLARLRREVDAAQELSPALPGGRLSSSARRRDSAARCSIPSWRFADCDTCRGHGAASMPCTAMPMRSCSG